MKPHHIPPPELRFLKSESLTYLLILNDPLLLVEPLLGRQHLVDDEHEVEVGHQEQVDEEPVDFQVVLEKKLFLENQVRVIKKI